MARGEGVLAGESGPPPPIFWDFTKDLLIKPIQGADCWKTLLHACVLFAEPRILKYTESNLDRKKELIKAHEASVKAKKAASSVASSTAPPAAAAASGQKRKAGEGAGDASPAPSSHSDASKSPKVKSHDMIHPQSPFTAGYVSATHPV